MSASDMTGPPCLSETEQRVLELYDKLQELQIELALLKGQQDYSHGASPPRRGETTQLHLLEAKAALALRNDVVESVMTVQPILEAVHNGTQASPVERDLSPYVEQRDRVAVKAAIQSGQSEQARHDLQALEVESVKLKNRNAQLASAVLRMAAKSRRRSMEMMDDPQLKRELDEMENEARASRQRWKVIKGTASAVVVGSGIDWVQDERLKGLVLDAAD
ncbi:centromere protein H (CENP-H)-domain-containing protein [Cercophora scortea]|uniref:Centromere protein H (CENP-H)-domain-containing protein n=1 Tax=Cercophora scortea TaxID=314031 RepID=A0AAE0MMP5_9PEZI|nr:centromere protein H (CENP-H)-domain-containing protein [Cercophora scortea]